MMKPTKPAPAERKRLSHGRRASKDWSNKAADRHLAAGLFFAEISEGGWAHKIGDRKAWFASLFWMDEIMGRLEEIGMKPVGRAWNQESE